MVNIFLRGVQRFYGGCGKRVWCGWRLCVARGFTLVWFGRGSLGCCAVEGSPSIWDGWSGLLKIHSVVFAVGGLWLVLYLLWVSRCLIKPWQTLFWLWLVSVAKCRCCWTLWRVLRCYCYWVLADGSACLVQWVDIFPFTTKTGTSDNNLWSFPSRIKKVYSKNVFAAATQCRDWHLFVTLADGDKSQKEIRDSFKGSSE